MTIKNIKINMSLLLVVVVIITAVAIFAGLHSLISLSIGNIHMYRDHISSCDIESVKNK
jgi:hypothetical protein